MWWKRLRTEFLVSYRTSSTWLDSNTQHPFAYVSIPPKAPAKKFVEQGQALQLELGSATSSLHRSTQSVVKGTLKNASRQYQRTVQRFNMGMNLRTDLTCFLFFLGLYFFQGSSTNHFLTFLVLVCYAFSSGPTCQSLPEEFPNFSAYT